MYYDKIIETSKFIKERIKALPEIGIVLGSGLGQIVDILEDKVILSYKDIPNFPVSSLQGHAGNLVIGKINNKQVVVMQGRFHYYEGFSMKELTFPIYVMKFLGVKDVIVTNACGAINESYSVGDMMLIDDYINFIGDNSLIGANDDRLGLRFPDMSEPYALSLLNKAKEIGDKLNISYQVGTYAFFNGPCFESKAEIRAFKAMGADVVGMSTVPETIAANYLGMNVLGIACITNMATGIAKTKHSHEEVLAAANKTSGILATWILELIKNW